METLSVVDLLLACVMMGVGALVQGAAGFGSALVAAPILALIEPGLVPGTVLASTLILNLLVIIREKSSIRFGEVKLVLAGLVPGTALGAALLVVLPQDLTGVLIGLAVIAAVIMSVSGLRIKVAWPGLLGAGLLSGFMGTSTSLGGPPIALLFQDVAGSRLRGSLASCFFFGSLLSLISLHLIGRFGRVELLTSLWLMPGVIIGFAVSSRLARILDRGYTRPIVLGLSGAAATAVLARSLF